MVTSTARSGAMPHLTAACDAGYESDEAEVIYWATVPPFGRQPKAPEL